MKNNIHFLSYLTQFFSEWEMSQIKVVKKIKTHFSSITLFLLQTIQFMRIWKNNVEPGRQQMTIWCMHIACCITKATDTYWQYVILIAFPLQQVLYPLWWSSGILNNNNNNKCCGIKQYTQTEKLQQIGQI